VLDWKAGTMVPDLKVKLTDDAGQQFVFRSYVSGTYLINRRYRRRFLFSYTFLRKYFGTGTFV